MAKENLIPDAMTLQEVYDSIGEYMKKHPESAKLRTVLVAHDEHVMYAGSEDIIGRSFLKDNNWFPMDGPRDPDDAWICLTQKTDADDPEPVVTLGWPTFDDDAFPEG